MNGLLAATGALAISTVSPCELIRDGGATHRPVVLKAVYAGYYHGVFLYDPLCDDGDASFDVVCDPAIDTEQCTKGLKRIAKTALQDQLGTRAEVVLEGWLKPWDGYGFGHLGGARYQFLVRRVIDVRPIKASSPWPSPARSSFMDSVEAIRLADLQFVMQVTAGADLTTLAPGFKLTTAPTPASVPALCATGRTSIENRIFPNGPIAFVQGTFECEDAGKATSHVYAITYAKKDGVWKPLIGHLSWAR